MQDKTNENTDSEQTSKMAPGEEERLRQVFGISADSAKPAAEVKPDIEPEDEDAEDGWGNDTPIPEFSRKRAEPAPDPAPDPRVVALQNLCADIRSFFAARNATALAIVAELRDPERMPKAQGAQLHVLEQYRSTLRDLYAIRVALDEYKVHTAPEAGSEHHGMWADYSDRIFRAHDLRKQLG